MKRINVEDPNTPWSIETTLLDLVVAVQDVSRTDDEVVSVISRMMQTGRVVLRGIFSGTSLGPRAAGKRKLGSL